MEIELWRIYMEENLKQLLLKDLCARLPYHTIVKYRNADVDLTQYARSIKFTECKPYLRPLSSMTEEEKNNLGIILPCSMSFSYSTDGDLIIYTDEEYDSDHYFSKFVEVQDFLNAHHFDYRGLISMRLALPAPEEMYN